MTDRFFSPGVSTSEIALRGETKAALTELKKHKSFTDKPKPLAAFLKDVWSVLLPFNTAGNTSIAQYPGLKPPGSAYAVYKALMEKSTDFEELVTRHNPDGLKKVYLAAMYMTLREDDPGAIRNLQQMLRSLEISNKSVLQTEIASNPRSPFRALVLKTLRQNLKDTAEDIWTKLQGLDECDCELEFNGNPVTVDMDFFITGDTKEERRKKSYVEWNIGVDEPTPFKRSSLDKMISELRSEHGLLKCI